MSSSVIIGTQWGDEGKGKIIDIIKKKLNKNEYTKSRDNSCDEQ